MRLNPTNQYRLMVLAKLFCPGLSYNTNMEPIRETLSTEVQQASESRRQWPVRIKNLHDQTREDDLDGTTIEQRWDMMWPLAVSAWTFKGEEDADAEGLPRIIARLVRRRR